MPKLIVLEGPDACGKTTLAFNLARRLGAKYIHATYRFKDRIRLYHLGIIRQAVKHLEAGQSVVLDRWWPSELVYGNVYRDGKREPSQVYRILHRLALRYGVTYVVCLRKSPQSLQAAFKKISEERAEMYPSDERIAQLHEEYDELYKSQAPGRECRWFHYNCDAAMRNPNYFTACLGMIVNLAEWNAKLASYFQERIEHAVGCPTARVLFVGERANPTYKHLPDPWIGFKGSSWNMATALSELRLGEDNFMWSNAYIGDQRNDQLADFLSTAPMSLKVVAMGEVAAKFCKEAKNCDVEMQHPAYVTRFHGQDALTEVLRKVLL